MNRAVRDKAFVDLTQRIWLPGSPREGFAFPLPATWKSIFTRFLWPRHDCTRQARLSLVIVLPSSSECMQA